MFKVKGQGHWKFAKVCFRIKANVQGQGQGHLKFALKSKLMFKVKVKVYLKFALESKLMFKVKVKVKVI